MKALFEMKADTDNLTFLPWCWAPESSGTSGGVHGFLRSQLSYGHTPSGHLGVHIIPACCRGHVARRDLCCLWMIGAIGGWGRGSDLR